MPGKDTHITGCKRGSYNGSKILEPESYDLLWKPWIKIGRDGSGGAIGLSWFLGDYRGEKTVSHSGGDTGFNTNLVMLPEKSIAVVVLCNYIPAPVGQLSNAVLDVLLGFEPDKFVPPASFPVLRVLADKGLSEAVTLWNSLKQDNAEEYDFNLQQFRNMVFVTLEMNRVLDGEALIPLLVEILPEPVMRGIRRYIENYKKNHPDNKSGVRMLEIIDQK